MGFLENLKTLGIHIEGNHFHFFSGNSKVISKSSDKSRDNRRTNIDITKLDALTLARLQAMLPEAVRDEDAVVLEEKSERLIEEFHVSDQRHRELILFFTGKLPNTDIEILRAAIFLKNAIGNNRPLAAIKDDLIYRYGIRGNNISNLYSAGYYESVIKRLYEEMSKQPSFVNEKFLQTYEQIVMQIPFAVFCNKAMSEDELLEVVTRKILRNVRYGIHKLNLHGIGKENTLKVLNVVERLQPGLTEPPTIESGSGYINVTIYFDSSFKTEENSSSAPE